MTAMIALTALILANPMRRGALDFVDFVDFVNLVSITDFCSKQSESEHSFLILASATSSSIIFTVHKLSKFVHWRHQHKVSKLVVIVRATYLQLGCFLLDARHVASSVHGDPLMKAKMIHSDYRTWRLQSSALAAACILFRRYQRPWRLRRTRSTSLPPDIWMGLFRRLRIQIGILQIGWRLQHLCGILQIGWRLQHLCGF